MTTEYMFQPLVKREYILRFFKHFPYTNALGSIANLATKRLAVKTGSTFKQICVPGAIDIKIQSQKLSWFLKRFLNVFTTYGYRGHLD